MRVVDVIAEILKREGVNHLNWLPHHRPDRSGRRHRYPAHRLPPGARGGGHRRWLRPRHQRRFALCFHHAVRAGGGKRLSGHLPPRILIPRPCSCFPWATPGDVTAYSPCSVPSTPTPR